MNSTQNQFISFHSEGRWSTFSIMEQDEEEDMVSDKFTSAISSSQNQLLTEMSKLISTELK